MDDRLIELYVERGRLQERIRQQRSQVAQTLVPVRATLDRADQVRALARQAQAWVAAHPAIVTAVAVTVLVWRPRAVFSTLRWGYSLWRQWKRLRNWAQAA